MQVLPCMFVTYIILKERKMQICLIAQQLKKNYAQGMSLKSMHSRNFSPQALLIRIFLNNIELEGKMCSVAFEFDPCITSFFLLDFSPNVTCHKFLEYMNYYTFLVKNTYVL